MINIALMLTFARLIGSTTLLPLVLTVADDQYSIIAALIFLFFASTDFFDGYYARKYNIETSLGKILDPIADKFLITNTILCLVVTKQFPLIFAIPLIMREIAILSLRQYAIESKGITLNVSQKGKIKTMLQYVALFFSILVPLHQSTIIFVRNILISIATFFSMVSFVGYVDVFLKKIKE